MTRLISSTCVPGYSNNVQLPVFATHACHVDMLACTCWQRREESEKAMLRPAGATSVRELSSRVTLRRVYDCAHSCNVESAIEMRDNGKLGRIS